MRTPTGKRKELARAATERLLVGERSSQPQEDRAALLEKEFDRLDPDQNGFIEPRDLLVAIHEEQERRGVPEGEYLSMRDVTFIINRLDGVGGQKDGVLELREFVRGMQNV